MTLLVPGLAIIDSALEGPRALSHALGGCHVAEGWEVFPGALSKTRDALAEDPEGARWGTRFFLLDEPRTHVGWGGFKGPPVEGVVELGYSIAPDFRGRGIASEAVRAMLREALSWSEVRAVIAHTLAEPGASVRVLEKTGFGYDGEAREGDSEVWRWRHERPV